MQSLGLEFMPLDMRDAEIERNVPRTFPKCRVIETIAGTEACRMLIISIAARHKSPSVYYTADGGLISYGPNPQDRDATGRLFSDFTFRVV